MVSTEMTSSESRDCLRTATSFSSASKSIYSETGEKGKRELESSKWTPIRFQNRPAANVSSHAQ